MQRLSMHLAAARRRELVASRHPRWCRFAFIARPVALRRRPRRGLSVWDLLIVAALIPLAVIGCMSGMCSSRETANRVKCASNLRQIGQAISLYANDNRGAYPRTFATAGSVVTPVWGTGAAATQPFGELGLEPNDVTAGLFLLMRTQDIGAEVFVCPSSNGEKWDFGGGNNNALNWSNWEGRAGIKKHLSYSYANPYLDDAAKFTSGGFKSPARALGQFAIASDMNPGIVEGGVNILSVTTSSPARDMKNANSSNHDRDGQNVLYDDFHVEFQQNPFVGVKRDNIFTRRADSTGFASAPGPIGQSPYDTDDSVLLPPEE